MPAAALKVGATRTQLTPPQIAIELRKLVAAAPVPPEPLTRGAKTKVFLADDHQIVLEGLHVLIEGEADMRVVGRAEDGTVALQRISELAPDVIVLDICMPGLDGVEVTHQIVSRESSAKVVALSSRCDAYMVNRMLEAGATGYLTKGRAFGELAQAIRAVKSAHLYLSRDVERLVDARWLV
jgi:DNA-binding NarL/FixJ family response regulator